MKLSRIRKLKKKAYQKGKADEFLKSYNKLAKLKKKIFRVENITNKALSLCSEYSITLETLSKQAGRLKTFENRLNNMIDEIYKENLKIAKQELAIELEKRSFEL